MLATVWNISSVMLLNMALDTQEVLVLLVLSKKLQSDLKSVQSHVGEGI